MVLVGMGVRVGALVRGIWVHEDQSNWRCMCVSVGGCGMPYKSLPMRMLFIYTPLCPHVCASKYFYSKSKKSSHFVEEQIACPKH